MFSSQQFREVMAGYATGVAVATAALPDGRRAGLTINSFTSVSLDPPLVLFCLEHKAAASAVFAEAEGFAVNILREGQENLSKAFAMRGQDEMRWQGLETETWESGAPILPETLASLDCRMEARHEAGDHVILVGRVLRLERRGGQPLVYWSSAYQKIG